MGDLDNPKVANLIAEVGEEVRSGAAIVFPMCVWVARAVQSSHLFYHRTKKIQSLLVQRCSICVEAV